MILEVNLYHDSLYNWTISPYNNIVKHGYKVQFIDSFVYVGF